MFKLSSFRSVKVEDDAPASQPVLDDKRPSELFAGPIVFGRDGTVIVLPAQTTPSYAGDAGPAPRRITQFMAAFTAVALTVVPAIAAKLVV